MLQRRYLASLLILSGLVSAGPAFGESGTFTFVTGDVNVQRRDGQRVVVTRGTPVNPGDAIVTGTQGMAQLTMVDQAKISLRPNTQFQIEQYADRPDSDQGALLNLVRGTLRTFTGLIAARNRDRFVMKTKVATVGIRGSGNVLFAGTAADCDPDKVETRGTGCDITVNHTIEGSHAVTFGDFSAPGLPPQQGGAQTLITGPGQTVLVTGRGDVRYIPTPQFIADSATNPTGAARSTTGTGDSGGETRNYGPNDGSGSSTKQGTTGSMPVGNNGLGFTFVDAAGNLVSGDPLGLSDIVMAGGGTISGQALRNDMAFAAGALRGYGFYPGLQEGLAPYVSGGTAADAQSFSSGGLTITAGRWANPSTFGYFGEGTGGPLAGSVHWIFAGSGFPAYLSDVLTGTATYTQVMQTSPTNQSNTTGTLTGAQLAVNFTNRTLNASAAVSLPQAGQNAGGSWQITAQDVPFALGAFYASTSDRLRIANGSGQSSATNANIYGSFEGSFVGSGLQGAIAGYNFTDQSSSNPANFNTVNGVVGFQGPVQATSALYRDGLVSDPTGSLSSGFIRNYATSNRPDETSVDAQGRADRFAVPAVGGGRTTFSLGTSTVAQSGIDPDTGLVWGRWAGGTAQMGSSPLPLQQSSVHYVFSGEQNGPVALPLTGTATYSMIGSTTPTDGSGHTGTLNSATLSANFTNRTVDAGVNVTMAGQTIAGSATGVPIYREQYFSAFRGNVPAGLPVPQLLNITCSPACSNPTGSIDGFFAGRSGQGAGMMYNLNGATGATAFRRPGG